MENKKVIIIKSLTLKNFKGIKNLFINLNDGSTEIYGANAVGKTSIFDAVSWMLFGKDSFGKSQFGIKTLDENNVIIPMLDTEVSALILVDNEEIKISRILRERWVKRRGSIESEFSGNETLFFWNEVPQKAGEYQERINELVSEDVFKMITNPLAFTSLHWEQQRAVLLEIVGGVSNDEVAKSNKDFSNVLSKLSNKSLEDLKKEIKAKIKASKDEVKFIPTRIDEATSSIPEALNFDEIEKEISGYQSQIDEIDEQIKNANLAIEAELKRQSDVRIKLQGYKSDVSVIEKEISVKADLKYQEATAVSSSITQKIDANNSDITEFKKAIKQLESRINTAEKDKASLNESLTKLRAEWISENSKVFEFDENLGKCLSCNRDFEENDTLELKEKHEASFNSKKIKTLDNIQKKASELQAEIKEKDEAISTLKTRIEKGKSQIETAENNIEILKEDLTDDNSGITLESFLEAERRLRKSEIDTLKSKIAVLEIEISEFSNETDNSDLEVKKKYLISKIDDLNKQLYSKELIAIGNARVKELKAQESALIKVINDLEREEFEIEAFNKAKIEMLETKVNDKFEFVKFSLFEQQINGGEKETCQALINGVPFSDANTGGQINAGLDIINTLCNHYNISAPIFIDNAESVDIFVSLNSQNIRLIKNTEDKKLRIV